MKSTRIKKVKAVGRGKDWTSLAAVLGRYQPTEAKPGLGIAGVTKSALPTRQLSSGKDHEADQSRKSSRRGAGVTPLHVAPDPARFSVLRVWAGTDGLLLAELRFASATNYDGRKLVLLSGVHEQWLREPGRRLDPHFVEVEGHPVVARFAPTTAGYRLALALIGDRTDGQMK